LLYLFAKSTGFHTRTYLRVS